MTYPKGYNPPSSPGGMRPNNSPDRKGHRGAAVALIIIFILIIAGVGVYSATRPHQTYTSSSTMPSSQPSSVPSSPVTETEQVSDCDPSYPDFCIPSPPPDLNCADVSQKRFTVSGSDPHGFDRDGDGVGCES